MQEALDTLPDDVRTITVEAIAEEMGVHPRTVRRQLTKAGIQVIYPTRQPRVRLLDYKRHLTGTEA